LKRRQGIDRRSEMLRSFGDRLPTVRGVQKALRPELFFGIS